MDFDAWMTLLGAVVVPLIGFLIKLAIARHRSSGSEASPATPPRQGHSDCVEQVQGPPEPRTAEPVEIGQQPTLILGPDQDFRRKYKGFLPHWHLGPGSYNSRRDFLWLEYEVDLKKPARVLVQVEGPTEETQPRLNSAKRRTAQAILGAVSDIATRAGVPLQRGKQASESRMRQTRSSTLFVSDLRSSPGPTPQATADEAIRAVHRAIGDTLDQNWPREYPDCD